MMNLVTKLVTASEMIQCRYMTINNLCKYDRFLTGSELQSLNILFVFTAIKTKCFQSFISNLLILYAMPDILW